MVGTVGGDENIVPIAGEKVDTRSGSRVTPRRAKHGFEGYGNVGGSTGVVGLVTRVYTVITEALPTPGIRADVELGCPAPCLSPARSRLGRGVVVKISIRGLAIKIIFERWTGGY